LAATRTRTVEPQRASARRLLPVAPDGSRPSAHRVITLVATLSLFGVSFASWSTIVQVPAAGALAVTGFAAGLALVLAVLLVDESSLGRVDVGVTCLALLLLAAWATSTIYLQPGYGTDEAAFEQYAASLLLHGHDPYGASLLPALTEFRVPIQYATYLLNGSVAHTLSYPALPVLVTAAFVPLTHGVQSVVIGNVIALALTCVATFFLLPRSWRALAPLLTIGLPILFGYSVSGVNAILMGLPLVVVAWRWTEAGRGRRDTGRAVCLGLALSVQPLAWFIAPFVLVGIWRLTRARIAGRYAAIALGTFALVNLPFVVWNPGAWFAGVTATVTQKAIPYGQGVIDVALFFHTGGGGLVYYTVAGALLYTALLIVYAVRFDRLGMACFVLPVVALFLTTRSLAEYLMVLVVVWAVSLLTNDPGCFRRVRALSTSRALPAALLAPAVAALALALAVPAPLQLSVLSVHTNGELEGVWKLSVAVTNRSDHRLSPHFAVNYMGQATTFFHRLGGPAELAPKQRAVYTLAAPNRGSMPGIETPFVVVATTSGPDTVSVSRRFVPQAYAADLEPGYVNRIIGPHGSVTFRVALRSPFGAFVHDRGVRIALGQVIYAQDGLIPSQASINGRPEGQTPVYATTDEHGVAIFRITDPQPQTQPLYFQAWVAGSYPYGYSQIVPVLWRGQDRS
jgi:uncharacterized membrane protein